ncbi:hypothetical protein C9374_005159 [Naegleria lovaniensis]|uniref:Peptidyl-prolyl cis-trans isomerase n=1 Tax=Naegleria lovaniensis TaxID=51637 RepID=A0AA88KI92_NAELO|nr:uncharacterized protein C9374_005159 [Naegleria lovaniensis]KAG2382579.1 hypothetical protein C9374_005159 [Naegleria lovaniensis]
MSLTLETNLGPIKIELFCEQCPKTCKNFLALCASGYYDNTIFHRNVPRFIIQGGDREGTGKGGTSIYGKFFEDEFSEELTHNERGIVGMANRSKPNTNSSQFYITYGPQPQLNNQCAVFGKVIDGFKVLDKMESIPVDNKYKPLQDIKILSVHIHSNPIATFSDISDNGVILSTNN